MHKITKGLKKKKKGKKSKHKEEELFKPEELEAYRKEHQQLQQQVAATEASASTKSTATVAGNEEWKKFIQLTAGVDDILKKTQGDLDRIKSTSFFQRVPTPSELKRQEEEEIRQEEKKAPEPEPPQLEPGIVPVSESESEEEDEDDIFDTAYIDAIATGEVKLAYIPESPTEQAGDDPFDTSIAERAILGPAVERKGKKLVPIGAAVEVLTGRVQAPTCATRRPISTKRQILKEQNLLLSSFDDNANSLENTTKVPDSPPKKTLLDEDESIPFSDEPVDLSKTLHQISVPTATLSAQKEDKENTNKDILEEFDVIKKGEDDDNDDEFALLAAESLSKTPVTPTPSSVHLLNGAVETATDWKPFGETTKELEESDDPFDTTFAENILPGKAELKIIEKEILDADVDFNPRVSEQFNDVLNKISIQITDPGGQRESVSSLDRISENELNVIKSVHRDLLGGSNTDLSSLGEQPLKPSEKINENYIEYCDPFDTSAICNVPPGQAELKFLEKELLGDIKKEVSVVEDDDDFDPRATEVKPKERTLSRPEILNVASVKSVSFDLSPPKDLLEATDEEAKKASKPLTPYYVRKDSIPELANEDDPFDTSFVSSVAPGKAELKIIESDLFDPQADLNRSISDDNFNPRDERQAAAAILVQQVQEIYNPKPLKESRTIDLLAVEENVEAKVLTPVAEKAQSFDENFYADPFDTSIASNILPGRTELKLLETELIQASVTSNSQQQDLLHSEDSVIDKPLSPVSSSRINSVTEEDDFDPFDTSIANNIAPGKTELKLLESELI